MHITVLNHCCHCRLRWHHEIACDCPLSLHVALCYVMLLRAVQGHSVYMCSRAVFSMDVCLVYTCSVAVFAAGIYFFFAFFFSPFFVGHDDFFCTRCFAKWQLHDWLSFGWVIVVSLGLTAIGHSCRSVGVLRENLGFRGESNWGILWQWNLVVA